MNYKPFTNFVFRTPAYPLDKYQQYISDLENGKDELLLSDDYFLESIYIASPILYNEIQKYKSGKLPSKEKERLLSTMLRYLIRMSWRCTPFGLFSGCSLGVLSDENKVIMPLQQNFNRHTRLDMNYLCALIFSVSQKDDIRSMLKYYPNTSLYLLGNQLRYIEYTFQNTNRIHNIISVDSNPYLQTVLAVAEDGKKIDFLANLITKDDITHEEAEKFIIELIENQLLVSELEPAVTGSDVLDTFIKKLCAIDKSIPEIKPLVEIQKLLSKINRLCIGETISLYEEIIANIKILEVDFDVKFLFQTDVVKTPIHANISNAIIKEIQDTLVFINRLTSRYVNFNLNSFRIAFYSRYEDKEIPLSVVMDNEIGLGYPISNEGDVAPLLNDFFIPNKQKSLKNQYEFDHVQSVLHKKYLEAITHKKFEINLSESDFDLSDEDWTDTPDTLMAICRFFSLKEESKLIYLSSCGGSSAANLLTRFAHADKNIEDNVLQITEKEKNLQEEAILAEIVHLPESRIGNIIFRPIIRDYEIPYLAQSSVDKKHQIPISDLFISVRNNQLFLRSKRHNKRIIPRLTNAHNYSMNGMPLYQFLCDLQTENQRAYFKFNWSELTNDFPFLPRVTYKNVILSLARWIVKTEELKVLIDDGSTLEKIMAWRLEKVMPRYLFLPDGDNEFFIDMENFLTIKCLFDLVKSRKQFYLIEYPIDTENTLVTDSFNNKYTNEFIFGFYKEKLQ